MSCYIVNITIHILYYINLFKDIYPILWVPCSLNFSLSFSLQDSNINNNQHLCLHNNVYITHTSVYRKYILSVCLSVHLYMSLHSLSLSIFLSSFHQIMLIHIAKAITIEQVKLLSLLFLL